MTLVRNLNLVKKYTSIFLVASAFLSHNLQAETVIPSSEDSWGEYVQKTAKRCATPVASFLAEPLVFHAVECVVENSWPGPFMSVVAYHCAKTLTSQGISWLNQDKSLNDYLTSSLQDSLKSKKDAESSKDSHQDSFASRIAFFAESPVFKSVEALGMVTLASACGTPTGMIACLGYKAVSTAASYALAKKLAPEGTKVLCSAVERGIDSFFRCFLTSAKTPTPA